MNEKRSSSKFQIALAIAVFVVPDERTWLINL